MGTISILSPIIEPKTQSGAGSELRVKTLKGKKVGFLSNGWPSLSIVLPKFEEVLRNKYGVAEVSLTVAGGDAKGRADGVKAIVDGKCDLAIVALGN